MTTSSVCKANWGGTHTPVRKYEVPHTFIGGTYIHIEQVRDIESAPRNAKFLGIFCYGCGEILKNPDNVPQDTVS